MRNNLYTPSDLFAVARNEAEIANLLNTDIYKFLMQDFILANEKFKDLIVTREITVRSKDIKTAEIIPIESLIEQLDACKNIKGLSEADLSYLRGMQQTNGKRLFQEETLNYLKDFQLGDYKITVEDGNYNLEFRGPWANSMMWEIYGLKVINSLYLYHYIKKAKLTNYEFDKIITETKKRLYEDIGILKTAPGLTFSEFGTRRSASTDYHRMIFEILKGELKEQCLGSSNVLISREFGLDNPRGTNAHELRMIPTALYDEPKDIKKTMYEIDTMWNKHFEGLGILLPDTYGTSSYYENCPNDIITNHNGIRFDSKDPMIAIPEYINWLLQNGENPLEKTGIPSDGLNAKEAIKIYNAFSDKLGKLSFGIGTNLTNNTKGTFPIEKENFGPFGSFSVVIKPSKVQRPSGEEISCVKLSDNFDKATGDKERIKLFRKIFGNERITKQKVSV